MSQFTEAEVAKLKALAAIMSGAVPNAVQQAAAPGTDVAPDFDLDGQYGNEEIKKDPSAKYWSGEVMSGRGLTMKDCPPEYLDAFAKWKDASAYMKLKANETTPDPNATKYAGYDKKSAARARGWAARIRAGKVVQTPRPASAASEGEPSDANEEIPF